MSELPLRRYDLDFQSREIATILALTNMAGVNPQLQSHFRVVFNFRNQKVKIVIALSAHGLIVCQADGKCIQPVLFKNFSRLISKLQNKLPKNESVSMLIPWASTLALLYNKRVLNSIAFATELNL